MRTHSDRIAPQAASRALRVPTLKDGITEVRAKPSNTLCYLGQGFLVGVEARFATLSYRFVLVTKEEA